jgi:hypothetical protein
MSARSIQVSDDFWNFRGSFKVAGVLDVGTQASLVRLGSGRFVFLDAYSLSPAARREVDELTNYGEKLEAILNLHPFHTLHVERMNEMYPQATLYGTARHLEKFPELPWADLRTEDPALHKLYAADFDFSVPRGVDFISSNESLHFSSVLALHRASKTIHSDDTLMYVRLPLLMSWMSMNNSVSFHPTLARVLEKRAGAVQDFRDWATELIKRWKHAENLCAAHTAALLAADNRGDSIHTRLLQALEKVEPVLKAHEEKYG